MTEEKFQNTIQRAPHDRKNPYAQINRHSLQNNNISWGATGMLSYLLSQTEGWIIRKGEICSHKTNGRDAGRAMFDELLSHKYIFGVQLYKNNLKCGVKYYLYETPYESKEEELKIYLRHAENQDSEIQNSEKPRLIKINGIKIKKKESKPKKNETSKKTVAKAPLASSDAYFLSNFLFDDLKKKNPTYKKPNIDNWAKDIDLMIRIDKREPEKIKEVIEWASQEGGKYWPIVIKSTTTLRKVFDDAVVEMNYKSVNTPEGNKELAAKVAKNFAPIRCKQRKVAIHLYENEIEFSHLESNAQPIIIGYNDKKFKDRINYAIKKLGL